MHIKSLDVKTRILVGDNHLDVAISHGNIGSVLIQVYMGKHEEALGHMQKGLEIELKLLGNEHPLVADSLVNIGVVYRNKGNRVAATEMYTKAYRIFLKVLGPDHPKTQQLVQEFASVNFHDE